MFATQRNVQSASSQVGGTMLLPLSAVDVAEPAHFHLVCVLPHQRVVLPWHALGTAGHAEQAVLEVGTLSAVTRTLKEKKRKTYVYNSLERSRKYYVNGPVS